jgi:hypothetical protein
MECETCVVSVSFDDAEILCQRSKESLQRLNYIPGEELDYFLGQLL